MQKNNSCRIDFLNTKIDNLTRQEALVIVDRLIKQRKSAYCVTPNVDHIVRLETDELFAEIYKEADLILADGQPLIWLSRFLGTPIKEKISGSDFFPLVCRLAAEKGYSIFLLGAAEGVAAEAAKKLKARYPAIKIAGFYSPRIGFENDEEDVRQIIELVNTSGADILCLGLGAPKQEKFYYQYRDKFKPLMVFNVGATIDFMAGRVRRAPIWMRRCGLEWLYRLCQEPQRLWKRYLVEDMKILSILWKYRGNNKKRINCCESNICSILNVPIQVTSMERVVCYIEKHIKELKGQYVTFVNSHTAVMAYDSEYYRQIQSDSFMCLPDGFSVAVACHLFGRRETDKVSGPDFFEEILKISEKYGWRHYFYGSTKDTLEHMYKHFKEKHPNLQIVGMYSPPFRPLTEEEDAEIIEKINTTNSDFIWVGLGAPKQETWMYEHRGKINGLMLGIGAAFDFAAGTLRRAPKWMQNCGLEWFYRLILEPRRLFRRYFISNSRFIGLVLRELWRKHL